MGHPLTVTVIAAPPADRVELLVKGEVDHRSGPALLAIIDGALASQPRQVDIDLSHARFVDSGGVDALVAADRLAREVITPEGCGCELRILRPSRPAQVALWAAGVDGYLQIVDDHPLLVANGRTRPQER